MEDKKTTVQGEKVAERQNTNMIIQDSPQLSLVFISLPLKACFLSSE